MVHIVLYDALTYAGGAVGPKLGEKNTIEQLSIPSRRLVLLSLGSIVVLINVRVQSTVHQFQAPTTDCRCGAGPGATFDSKLGSKGS